MSGFLYKPIGQGQIGGGRANFLIENPSFVKGGLYDSKGNLIENLNRFQGTPEAGQRPGIKFTASKPGGAYGSDLVAKFTDKNGKEWSYNIPNGGQRYEGTDEDPNSLKAVNKGPMGGGGITGAPGQFTPGQAGQYGVFPGYLGGMFPSVVNAIYNAIPGAKYNFTDPQKFAEKFGAFNRGEIQKNFNLSSDLALKELDTELKGLESFVPAAAALKRTTNTVDNAFNVSERIKSAETALPGVRGALQQQQKDASTYANGDVPNAVLSRALDINTGSTAADIASSGGFGARSSAARRITDLMSADKRIALSQYGNSLLQNNAALQGNLFLPPTEYSNAGQQVSVMPSQSATQLIGQQENALNGLSVLPTSSALGSETQQNQFQSGLTQQTQQFNAGNQLQLSEFNANNANNFALQQFGYNVGYGNQVAGAAQTNLNTNFQLQQQQQYMDFMNQYMQQAQSAGLTSSLFQLGSSVLGGFGGLGKGGGGGGGVLGSLGKGGGAAGAGAAGASGAAGGGDAAGAAGAAALGAIGK